MKPAAGGAPRPVWRLAWQSLAVGWRASPVGSAGLLIFTICEGALPTLAAWFAKLLMDELASAMAEARRVFLYAGTGACAVAASAICGHVVTLLAQYNRLAASAVLEARLFERVNRLVGLKYFDDPAYHDRLRFAQHSAQEAPGEVAACATQVIRGVVGVAGFLGVVVRLWPPLLVLMVSTAVFALGMQAWLVRVNVDAARRRAASERRRAVYQLMMLNARAAKEIRLYGLGSLFHVRMMRALRRGIAVEVAVSRREATVLSVFGVVGGAIAAVGTVIVGQRVLGGQATVGDVAFLMAAVAGMQSSLSGIVESFGRAALSARVFGEYLAIQDQAADLATGSREVAPLRQGIELRDVWFRYDDDGPWIVRGVSFTIPNAKAIGLVGVNGAGKSTLVKLLCRYFDPQRGAIFWDGVDIRDVDVAKLRSRFSATYQDYMDFDLTVTESIGIGDLAHQHNQERVRAAAALAEVHDAIEKLPRGYATMLSRLLHGEDEGERGVVLSGGQSQRLALARSIMREDADVLILDEPTAGLDPLAEHRIHAMLRERRRGRTTLMISHRLSVLRDADLIVVVAGGVVVEQGTHDELMAADNTYARLFTLQAAGYQIDRVGASP